MARKAPEHLAAFTFAVNRELTDGEVFLARMLLRAGLSAVGVVTLLNDPAKKLRASKTKHNKARWATLKARKVGS